MKTEFCPVSVINCVFGGFHHVTTGRPKVCIWLQIHHDRRFMRVYVHFGFARSWTWQYSTRYDITYCNASCLAPSHIKSPKSAAITNCLEVYVYEKYRFNQEYINKSVTPFPCVKVKTSTPVSGQQQQQQQQQYTSTSHSKDSPDSQLSIHV